MSITDPTGMCPDCGDPGATHRVYPTEPETGTPFRTKVTIAGNVDPSTISEGSMNIITDVLSDQGEPSALISSTYRSAKRQINAMFKNTEKDGVQSQLDLYSKKGDAVINEYAKNTATLALPPMLGGPVTYKTKSDSQIKSAMLAKAKEVGLVSSHSKDPKKVNVIDIDAASLKNPKAVGQAFRKHDKVQKVHHPPKDKRAVHVEINQENL